MKPSSTNSTYGLCNRYNNMVKSLILNSLSQDLVSNVIYVDIGAKFGLISKSVFLNAMALVSSKLREILSL